MVAAAKSGGAALIAFEARDGIRVAVRARGSLDFTVRRAVTSTGSVINDVAATADPKGGWVLAERSFPRKGSGFPYRIRTLSLRDDGRLHGRVQDLGTWNFGLDADTQDVLGVDADGPTGLSVAPYLCWAGEVKAGGALAWLLVRVGCARTPSLISVLDLGLPGVGDMMVDGGFRDAVRPLDL